MSLFVASFFLLLREGFEAILIVGRADDVPVKGRRVGAAARRGARRMARGRGELPDVDLVELLFQITPGQREALAGIHDDPRRRGAFLRELLAAVQDRSRQVGPRSCAARCRARCRRAPEWR
jgi:hypothetical protein